MKVIVTEKQLELIDGSLLTEGGIRDINLLADRYPKAEIYFHQDLDGVVSALGMKSYLENYGIKIIGVHVIQYGDKEFSVKKPDASGDVMPVLVDFAHGKPIFKIHTDHHDSQAGVEDGTSVQFRSSRSNVQTISQTISPSEIFTDEDITIINTVDSADYAKHGISPDQVMNYIKDIDPGKQAYENKWMMGLLTNKLLLAYKNKPGFLEELVMTSTPSLMNIYQNIVRIANEKGYVSPEELKGNQETYIKKQKDSVNVVYDEVDGIISQYGGGALFKPGSYDRYTPFKNYPDANFLVIAWPMGLVQASCNPFKKERALKGINLGDIAQEVLAKIEPQLKLHQVPVSVIKRIGETKATSESIGFKTSDLYALYKDHLVGMPSSDSEGFERTVSIIDTPWGQLSEEEKQVLDNITVSAWEAIQASSGGHKCITNISNLNLFGRGGRNPKNKYGNSGNQARYVKFVKWVQENLVKVLKEKISQQD